MCQKTARHPGRLLSKFKMAVAAILDLTNLCHFITISRIFRLLSKFKMAAAAILNLRKLLLFHYKLTKSHKSMALVATRRDWTKNMSISSEN